MVVGAEQRSKETRGSSRRHHLTCNPSIDPRTKELYPLHQTNLQRTCSSNLTKPALTITNMYHPSKTHCYLAANQTPAPHLADRYIDITTTMSAPQQGRQSPEPERQSDAQKGQQAQPNQQGAETKTQEKSDDQKSGLPSNPTHILEKHSEETTSKTVNPPN
ncbi:hypothetical protein BU25DRAFT_16579 [Macroventuria anomochaeta]|uniref:Uncharacterized protein n=1 Tax=Macroventuria anomochaeta TaxID=301207 RepID=A0ACB6SJL2_9PLEO|nr:uncharacterized protein BU25DRAFT_16579 [Macroventuria anomochaeta]KAF2633955.1 hypothetical protein BU25DRAFT_16579 [Macroventuria anomochaeta]